MHGFFICDTRVIKKCMGVHYIVVKDPRRDFALELSSQHVSMFLPFGYQVSNRHFITRYLIVRHDIIDRASYPLHPSTNPVQTRSITFYLIHLPIFMDRDP